MHRRTDAGDWSAAHLYLGPGGQAVILPGQASGQDPLADLSLTPQFNAILELPLDEGAPSLPDSAQQPPAQESSPVPNTPFTAPPATSDAQSPLPTAVATPSPLQPSTTPLSLIQSATSPSVSASAAPTAESSVKSAAQSSALSSAPTSQTSTATLTKMAKASTVTSTLKVTPGSSAPSTTSINQPPSTTSTTIKVVSSTEPAPPASSSSNLPTSSPSHQADAGGDTHTITGVVFGVFVGLAFLAAFIAWFFRLRMHRRRRRTQAGFSWSPEAPEDAERGLPFSQGGEKPDEGAIAAAWDRDKDAGVPNRSASWVYSRSVREQVSPVRQEANLSFAGPPPHRRVVSDMRVPPTPGSLYDVPFHVIRESPISQHPQSSPPGLDAPPILVHPAVPADGLGVPGTRPSVASEPVVGATPYGTLRVANPMPGDHFSSSGSEASPGPSTRASPMPLGSEFGTPRELGAAAPRFLGIVGGGLDMSRLEPVNEEQLATPRPLSNFERLSSPYAARNEMPLMTSAPTEQGLSSDPLAPGTAGWAASIRANLTNALAAVAERTGLGAAAPPAEVDSLTPAPVRGRRARVRDVEWGAKSDADSEDTALSRTSTAVDRGSVRAPEKAVVKGAARRPETLAVDRVTLSRDSSVYSVASAEETSPHAESGIPPLTPAPNFIARPLSQAGSLSSGDERTREGAASALERIRERTATRPRPSAASPTSQRPKLVVRTSWSESSDGGDSEAGSPNREGWTDDEKRAQRMLMERRKLNMGAGSRMTRAKLVGVKSIKRTGTRKSRKF